MVCVLTRERGNKKRLYCSDRTFSLSYNRKNIENNVLSTLCSRQHVYILQAIVSTTESRHHPFGGVFCHSRTGSLFCHKEAKIPLAMLKRTFLRYQAEARMSEMGWAYSVTKEANSSASMGVILPYSFPVR